MIQNPFRCGEPVSGDAFTGRYREREILMAELAAGRNVLLTAPRYYGRSSLARRVMSEFERQGIMTVYIDFERAYSLPRFVEQYLAELLRSAFRQAKELQGFIETLTPDFRKMLVFNDENSGALTVDLQEIHDSNGVAGWLLELAQLTSEYRKRPCVVCFDEVSKDGNSPEELRDHLRTVARAHTQVGYLLIDVEVGAKKDREDFTHLSLGNIEERYLKAFIKTRFENTGHRIEETVIEDILHISGGHPHFTQMICRELWNLGHNGKVVSAKNLTHALEAIQETHAVHYGTQWREFSLHQKNLLLAISVGGGKKIFSQEYVSLHNLGSFSTVQKSLSRLLAMQLIARRDECYIIPDVFFQQWINRRML